MFVEDQVQQWINKYGWKLQEDGNVFIVNQEENIKTKNITETITFESECVTKPFISYRKLVIYNLISIILMWHFWIYHYAMMKKIKIISYLGWMSLVNRFEFKFKKKFNWIDEIHL